MAQAYSIGMRKAQGTVLVYVHQDVRIMDFGFARAVKAATEPDNVGFAGVIGSTTPSNENWWDTHGQMGWVIRNDGLFWGHCAYDGPARQVDGLLMATRKRYPWPEGELPGVHFLDQWMCRYAESMGDENRIFSAAVQHMSNGSTGSAEYLHNLRLYQQRWRVKE